MTWSFGPSATGSSTVNPRPPDGPPSAWMSIATRAPESLSICARRSTQGPTPWLFVRVITTRAPSATSAARR